MWNSNYWQANYWEDNYWLEGAGQGETVTEEVKIIDEILTDLITDIITESCDD